MVLVLVLLVGPSLVVVLLVVVEQISGSTQPQSVVVVVLVEVVPPPVVVVVLVDVAAPQVLEYSVHSQLAADQYHFACPPQTFVPAAVVVVVLVLVVDVVVTEWSTTQRRSAFCRAVSNTFLATSRSVSAFQNRIKTGVPSLYRWGSYSPGVLVSRYTHTTPCDMVHCWPDWTARGIAQQEMPWMCCGLSTTW
jgi:hypothetical protein